MHRLALDRVETAIRAKRAADGPAAGGAQQVKQTEIPAALKQVERARSGTTERRQGVTELGRSVALVVGGIAAITVSWLLAIVIFRITTFTLVVARAQAGVEAATALALVFAAFVLFRMPPTRGQRRLHWLAGAFLLLGIGSMHPGITHGLFGLFAPGSNASTYVALAIDSLAGVVLCIGLVRRYPPRYEWFRALLSFGLLVGVCVLILAVQGTLPPLIHHEDIAASLASGRGPFPYLTPWYWAFSVVPFTLAVLAVAAAVKWCRDGTLGLWLLTGTSLWAGSLLHSMFWPRGYGQAVTTSDALQLMFSCVVAIGAVVELRSLAERRVARLAIEEDHARKLSELAVLKANFTAMVAHELGSPLGAIRGYADMLGTNQLDRQEQTQAIEAIHAEIDALNSLVRDVQTAASVEREDFVVRPRPVSLGSILVEAAAFAKTLPGDHPLRTTIAVHEMVWADPDRVRQVLRNLLTNAAKYTPLGVPIELSATRYSSMIRLEVADHGPGIRYEDVSRIFEKFGRGRDQAGRKVPGVGLGLYLSRRIVQAHGSILTVASRIGGGSVFGFELEVIL